MIPGARVGTRRPTGLGRVGVVDPGGFSIGKIWVITNWIREQGLMTTNHPLRLSENQLRWICQPERLKFETTADLETTDEIIGQETAREALRFGIQCLAPGQNIYVRGLRGTGRITLVRQLIRELAPQTDLKRDRCYVHNFLHPDRPRLLVLAPGTANAFQDRVEEMVDFISDGLRKALDSEPWLSERERVRDQMQATARSITDPLEKNLAANGLTLVSMQQGSMMTTAIFPVVEGEPVPPDQLRAMVAENKAPREQLERFEELQPKFQKEMDVLGRQVIEILRAGRKELDRMKQEAGRMLLGRFTEPIIEDFPGQGVATFIEEVVNDAVKYRLADPEEDDEPVNLFHLYGVNILVTHADHTSSPVVEEVVPNMTNLLGSVEPAWQGGQAGGSDYSGVRAGALLNADQGYLILEVEDLLSEPGAWRSLMRTLRTGRLEIVPPEAGFLRPFAVVQPEPIRIQLRVILIGDVSTYYMLDQADPDFRELFKVLADFEDVVPRDDSGLRHYSLVMARLSREESLLPFHRTGVAALIEHGGRIGGRGDRLTAKFGRVADIAREAAFVAKSAGRASVTGDDVRDAVKRTRARASLPSRRFQELVASGTIRIDTRGSVVGQVNGLAVIHAGPLTYGFPARITATIGPGNAGLINIEGHARMSGAIHTKGFYILGGLLRHLLQTSHPLSFSASITFEQSYGLIDGDSASGAEMVCLLSALTGIPLLQSMAMTGAIDQLGHVQAIGGANEKIEGYYDACFHAGLTGDQGVIIPAANSPDLMLRHDVVEACREGKFHVYAVSHITEAIELLTGRPSRQNSDGSWPRDSVVAVALKRAEEFWQKTLAAPQHLAAEQIAAAGAALVTSVQDLPKDRG